MITPTINLTINHEKGSYKYTHVYNANSGIEF